MHILFSALLNGDFRGGTCEIVGGGGGRGGLVVPVDFAAGDAWIIGQNISFQLRMLRKNDKVKICAPQNFMFKLRGNWVLEVIADLQDVFVKGALRLCKNHGRTVALKLLSRP